MKILFLGDIIGKIGRDVCDVILPQLKEELKPDLILANGENSSHGYGITAKVYTELTELGISGFTMGNHVWDKKDLLKEPDKMPFVARPANYPPGVPGNDLLVLEAGKHKVAVINLLGRVFMQCLDCPFQTIEKLLPKIPPEIKVIIVDMHADATSEKAAMGWFLDGKVAAVVGTHTHVMTADERLLPERTAYISDVGMVGARDSVIGMNKEQILKRFLTQMPEKFEPTEKGPGLFNAVLLTIDEQTGRATEIKRIIKTTN